MSARRFRNCLTVSDVGTACGRQTALTKDRGIDTCARASFAYRPDVRRVRFEALP